MAGNNLKHSVLENNPEAEDPYENCLCAIEKATALVQVASLCVDQFLNLPSFTFFQYFQAAEDLLESAKVNLTKIHI